MTPFGYVIIGLLVIGLIIYAILTKKWVEGGEDED